MATNTKELTIKGSEATLIGVGKVKVKEPDVKSILLLIHTDDLIEYVREYIDVLEIYPQSVLERWAESEGYVKAETQND